MSAAEPPAAPPGRFPRVDELFAGEPPPGPLDARPRLRLLRVLLAVALPLDLLGIPCWTGGPGALLTLWAWSVADAEAERVREGRYAPEDAERILRLRAVAGWALGLTVLSLLVQVWLLTTPVYARYLARVLDLLGIEGP